MRRPITTDEDQRASFVELFFDLVFVFAVTQIVGLVHDDPTWPGLGHAVVVFWLVWWSWTQYTWALNSGDTTHPWIKAFVLAATAIAFLMAVTIPDALGDGGAWFAVTYVTVRVLGLGVYAGVAWQDVRKRSALRLFSLLSAGGLAAVALGGVAPAGSRAWWWTGVIALDLLAAALAGRAEGWDIRPEHFGERHGLFVIIALGESLVVAASGLSGAERTSATIAVAVLAVAITCGLWWCYFVGTKRWLDEAVESRVDAARTTLVRDAYTIAHFPLILGVVLVAVGIEAAVAHPSDPLPDASVLALGSGVVLFVASTAAALRRAGRALPLVRLGVLVLLGGGLWLTADAPANGPLAVVVAALFVIARAGDR